MAQYQVEAVDWLEGFQKVSFARTVGLTFGDNLKRAHDITSTILEHGYFHFGVHEEWKAFQFRRNAEELGVVIRLTPVQNAA